MALRITNVGWMGRVGTVLIRLNNIWVGVMRFWRSREGLLGGMDKEGLE